MVNENIDQDSIIKTDVNFLEILPSRLILLISTRKVMGYLI